MPTDTDVEQKAFMSDAIMALISLGYGRSVAENAVREAARKLQTIDNIEVLVREALNYKT